MTGGSLQTKILVALPNNLGDVIMATPVLEGLKKKHKDASIAFFVEEGYEAGLINNPCCDRLIMFPRKQVRSLLVSDQWREGKQWLSRTVKDTGGDGLDLLVNLSQIKYVSMIVSLLASKALVGQHFLREGNHSIADLWSQYLYAIPYCRSCNNLHAVDVYRRIAGVKTHRGGYTVVLTDEEKEWARGFLLHRGVDPGNKIMLFQAGAAYPSKRWPHKSFATLGKLLANDGWRICIIGAPAEKGISSALADAIGAAAVSTAGETTFRQAIALLSCSKGCVTGDTALMHAAAGLDVRTYAIFGPTNPVETGPYGNGHFVFSGHCQSMPCFKTDCESCECMNTIGPADVYACIKTGECPTGCSCNVYATTLEENGDYALVPCNSTAHKYFHEVDVCLVRNIFADRWNCLPGASADYARGVALMGQWLETVSDMCNALIRYEQTRNVRHIKTFEQMKSSLDSSAGVGAFCTALLNIRLNSVPVLSPIAAVKQSIEECWQIHKQVGKAIA